MRYFISVSNCYERKKEWCKHRRSGRNCWYFQGMYYPINNQKFCIQQFWLTSWWDKWFQRTSWRKELVKKLFRWTGWTNKWFWQKGWCNKWFQLVVDGSDRKSNPRVATHSTNIISTTHTTNIISAQKLLINPTIQVVFGPTTPLVTADFVGLQENLSQHQRVLLKAKITGGGVQLCAYLPDSCEGKKHRKGWCHAMGRFFLQNEHHIEFTNPKFCSYLPLPSALQGTIYCQYKAPQ